MALFALHATSPLLSVWSHAWPPTHPHNLLSSMGCNSRLMMRESQAPDRTFDSGVGKALKQC